VSVRGSMGSMLAVAAFGRTMERHGIIIIAASRRQQRGTETVASQRGGRGKGGGVRGRLPPILSLQMRSSRGGGRKTPYVFSRGSRQVGSRGGGPRGPQGQLLFDRFRLATTTTMAVGTDVIGHDI
jgi:hypothetical protein